MKAESGAKSEELRLLQYGAIVMCLNSRASKHEKNRKKSHAERTASQKAKVALEDTKIADVTICKGILGFETEIRASGRILRHLVFGLN